MTPFQSIMAYLDHLWDDLTPDERTALANVQAALKEAGPSAEVVDLLVQAFEFIIHEEESSATSAEALAKARQWLADLRPRAVRLLRTGSPGKQELINRLRTLIASIAQQIHANALPITTRLPHTPDLAQTSLWRIPSNQVARVALEALQDAAEGAPSWAEEHGIPTYTRHYARNMTQMSLTIRGQAAATLSSTLWASVRQLNDLTADVYIACLAQWLLEVQDPEQAVWMRVDTQANTINIPASPDDEDADKPISVLAFTVQDPMRPVDQTPAGGAVPSGCEWRIPVPGGSTARLSWCLQPFSGRVESG
jgi:hypothetical protein